MNKEKIKKALKGLGVAGLVASVGLMTVGCKKAEEGTSPEEAESPETKVEEKGKTSCGKGSCGAKKEEGSKTSCGQGSCGGKKVDE